MSGGYPKFSNDRGVPEICIGVKEFMCISESSPPPQDHPHVYINVGEADTILCPYCATRFRFDPRLTPLDAIGRYWAWPKLYARPFRRIGRAQHTVTSRSGRRARPNSNM
jgi:uncharacterized Zn-finger protein